MPLFGKPKQPKEIIQDINESLTVLGGSQKNEKEKKKAVEEIGRSLTQLKELLTDKSDTKATGKEKDAELSTAERARINDIITEITHELIGCNMLPTLISQLDVIDFESSKYVVELFGHMMRRQIGCYNPATQYLHSNKHILFTLLHGYTKSDNAIHYGAMLRDACRHETLAKEVLAATQFYDLFTYVQGTAFDVSSDAFATLKDLLTRHKVVVAEFLDRNFDDFFKHYEAMVLSDNYVTKRQALKLLGELLLDRHNFTVMTRYISNVENLKLIMNMLKSKEKQIAFEAFHCFKVFVANPNKPRAIHTILYQNQEKLINFLTNFQTERTDDVQFNDEKQYLVKQIRDLKPPPAGTATSTTGAAGTPNAPAPQPGSPGGSGPAPPALAVTTDQGGRVLPK